MTLCFRSALSPFIPEQSKQRIVFAGSNWKEELLEIIDKDCLPERYGGTIPDHQHLDQVDPVPKALYWKLPAHYPTMDQLHKVSVSACKCQGTKESFQRFVFQQNLEF